MNLQKKLSSSFLDTYNLTNLVKRNICFEGKGSCLDLILTIKKYCFKIATAFETGLSEDSETAFVKTLTSHAPMKIEVFRGNHKLHINKVFQKIIIKRPQLKNKVSSRTKQPPQTFQNIKVNNIWLSKWIEK